MEFKRPKKTDIKIRHVEKQDLKEIMDIYNHSVKTSVFTLDLEEKTYDDMLIWYEQHTDRYPACVGLIGNNIVGFGSLSKWAERKGYFPSCEASIYLSFKDMAQGYGDNILSWLVSQARTLEFTTIISFMTSTNKLAKNLVRRNSFNFIGNLSKVGVKFDKIIDISIYQLMLN